MDLCFDRKYPITRVYSPGMGLYRHIAKAFAKIPKHGDIFDRTTLSVIANQCRASYTTTPFSQFCLTGGLATGCVLLAAAGAGWAACVAAAPD